MAGSDGTVGGAAGGWRTVRGTGATLAGVREEGIVEEIWKEPPGARVTVLLEVDLMGVVTSGVHLSEGVGPSSYTQSEIKLPATALVQRVM
jgi:hypothetical protein